MEHEVEAHIDMIVARILFLYDLHRDLLVP